MGVVVEEEVEVNNVRERVNEVNAVHDDGDRHLKEAVRERRRGREGLLSSEEGPRPR